MGQEPSRWGVTMAAKKSAAKKKAAKKKASKKAAAKKSAAKKGGAKKSTARKAATKKAAAKKPASKKAAAKKTASKPQVEKPAKEKPAKKKGAVSASEVHMGHLFSLRPRVNTSFKPDDLRAAKQRLEEEGYASIGEAARAVAELALELSHEGGGAPRNKGKGKKRF